MAMRTARKSAEGEGEAARAEGEGALPAAQPASARREGQRDDRGDHRHPHDGAQPEHEQVAHRERGIGYGSEREQGHRRASRQAVHHADKGRAQGLPRSHLPNRLGEAGGWMHVRVPVDEAVVGVGVAVKGRPRVVAVGLGEMLGRNIARSRRARAMRSAPSPISIAATTSSRESSTAGAIGIRKAMSIAPTAAMVAVWPRPQKAPTSAPALNRRVRLTMVATATT